MPSVTYLPKKSNSPSPLSPSLHLTTRKGYQSDTYNKRSPRSRSDPSDGIEISLEIGAERSREKDEEEGGIGAVGLQRGEGWGGRGRVNSGRKNRRRLAREPRAIRDCFQVSFEMVEDDVGGGCGADALCHGSLLVCFGGGDGTIPTVR